MDHTDYPFEFDEWLRFSKSRMRDPSDFIGDHRYRHFDGYVSHTDLYTNQSTLSSKLRDPSNLAQHSFLPFIRKDKKSRKYTRDKIKDGTKISQKVRPIMYASHRDASIYAFYSYLLKKAYEAKIADTSLNESVIAYRSIPRLDAPTKGKSNIDHAKEVSDLTKKHRRCVVICLDITRFFDTMDHQLIKQKWSELLGVSSLPVGHYAVYRNVTRYRYVFLNEALVKLSYGEMRKGKFEYYKGKSRHGILCTPQTFRAVIDSKKSSLIHKNRTDIGIPQGSPISDIIANLYLMNFDQQVTQRLGAYEFGYYRRYSDDLLIICPEDKAAEIYKYAINSILKEKLVIKPAKSEAVVIDNTSKIVSDVTHQLTEEKEHLSSMREAFQYLGFEIDAKDMHLRSGTVANHYRRALRRARALDSKNSKPTDKQPAKRKKTKSNRSRWQYFISSENRTGSERIRKQYKRVLKRAKRFSTSGPR